MFSNRSIPSCSVIPELPYPDVPQAAAWLCAAFGFTERLRIGSHRVQLSYGDGALVVVEQSSAAVSSCRTLVRVENAQAHCAQANRHGAKIIKQLQDHAFGERQYSAIDFAGHAWTFSPTIADIHPSDWGGELCG